MKRDVSPHDVLRDLARVRIVFQLRAIAAVLGPDPRRPDERGQP